MLDWASVAVGGAIGALARYTLTLTLHDTPELAAFPLATLVANVLGSILLAFIAMLAARQLLSGRLRLLFGTGFAGAFTTFSTFMLEADALLRDGAFTLFTLYLLGNVILGFLGVLLGQHLASRVPFR